MDSTKNYQQEGEVPRHWSLLVFGGILALIGVALAIGGVRLATLGGSWYYLLAGMALLVSGILYIRAKKSGLWVFAATFIATLIWAIWEAGFSFWPLVPRLAPYFALGLVAALLIPKLFGNTYKKTSRIVSGIFVLILVIGFSQMFKEHGVTEATVTPTADAGATEAEAFPEWHYYGKTPAGTRYVPFEQINKDNVNKLEVAWQYRTGEIATGASELQNTPIQVGNTLYTCTPLSKVIAIDADTGKERWVFDPKIPDTHVWNRCRGVGYYEPAAVQKPLNLGGTTPAKNVPGICDKRIVLTTIDARMMELDAETGKPCETFGKKGTVDLSVGLGDIKPNVYYYYLTSTPTVARNLIILGGWVFDGRSTDEPSGVIRAFSADTGELVWAWDMGNPNITKLPPEGETYTRSTPNVWSTPAFDDKLGLVYLPTGNHSPDFWGALRPEASEKYASAVVALDIATGRERWVFQTVHHDLWDYDIASQPALYDVPDSKGGKIPALVQLTKRGQIFLLDRRNGKPIADVVEKPVPQKPQKGDWTAPTQPYSVGMPTFGTEPLTEKNMWGATFFDQLACRIQFRQLNYEGEFTAPTTERTLLYPGYYGGFNWGSASINEKTGYLFLNDIRMPQIVQLLPQESLTPGEANSGHGVGSIYPQTGTPYAIKHDPFNSPLGIPCHEPPWGVFAAVDLKTRKLVWEKPAGTIQDAAINGMKSHLPIPVGMPTLGSGVNTGSGIVFYAGTQDNYLRAIEMATGKELWKGRLPVGGQATPMSYVSPATGRQYVVITAGGARQSPDRGDYVIAYALPKAN